MSDPKDAPKTKTEQPKPEQPNRRPKNGDKIKYTTSAGVTLNAKIESVDEGEIVALVVDKDQGNPACGFRHVQVPFNEAPKGEHWSW